MVLVPPESSVLVDWVMKHCDGVVITGGAFDIDPKWYGQTQGRLDQIDEGRTQTEMLVAQRAINWGYLIGYLWRNASAGSGCRWDIDPRYRDSFSRCFGARTTDRS